MDGNARWARKKKISSEKGYKKGLEKIKEIVDICINNKIKYLTIFALSSENIKRPRVEVIFKIIKNTFKDLVDNFFKENNIKVLVLGDKNNLPININNILNKIEVITKNNKLLNLNIAFNYGAINEIVFSINKIIKYKEKKNLIVNEQTIRDNLYLPNTPDPDILIRTGGFQRLSNFFLFQLSYTELFFTDTLWPDITKQEIETILDKYKKIERKYGL